MHAQMFVAILVLASGLQPGQDQKPKETQRPVSLRFGIYTSDRPSLIYKLFWQVLQDLEDGATKALGRQVGIELVLYKDYDESLEAFLRGEVDFVRFGPASYVLAKQRNPEIQLLVAEQDDGKKVSHGIIFVRADSPVRKLADLKGRRFAFGDDSSTIGRYLSQAELAKAGVLGKDLAGFKYLGRHDKVAAAVQAGDFDAGAVHLWNFEEAGQGTKLRELARFPNLSKPWLARAGLPQDVCDALRSALLGMNQPQTLKVLKVTGFLPVEDKEFDFVRDGMEKARSFEVGLPKTDDHPPAAPSGAAPREAKKR